jgi:hypothetical protein
VVLILAIANTIIGLSFTVVAGASVYLWSHRRNDWPKAWALAMLGLGIGSCGVARLAHAYTISLFPSVSLVPMAVADCLTATMAVVLTLFVPRAVYQIRLLPTPNEVRAAVEAEATTKEVSRQAFFIAQKNEILTRQTALLLAIIKATPTLPESLKTQVDTLIRDIQDADSLPNRDRLSPTIG